jgi:Gas vesicle synthesis protein GvpL/GvpF
LRLISARAPGLLEALALVRGREQMTTRLLGSRPLGPSAGGPGTQYLEERRRAHTLPELAPLRTLLAGLVRAERVDPHAEEGLVASVYHLIDRGRAARYRELVESASLPGLRASVTGPWPAWSFAPELSP